MKKIFSLLLICFTLCFSMPSVHAQEAFTINRFDVVLDVKENGEIYVKQTLQVQFDEPRHGLYFDIPTVYDMDWNIDGNIVSKRYQFPVSDIVVGNDMPYEVEEQSKGKRIIIGDEDVLVEGVQTYQISYVMTTKDLGLGGRQMLYQNLISPKWDTTIETANFEIRMPKIFDLSAIQFHIGEYGDVSDGKLEGFKYDTQNTTIFANLTAPLKNYEGVTIYLELPDNYFEYPKPFDWTWVIAFGCIAISIATIVIFFLYGKDGLIIKSVQFTVPAGLTCAAVSYIVDGHVNQKDVVTLLIEWANRGYLMIQEVDQKAMRLIKLRDMGDECKLYERRLFNALFHDSNDVYTDSLGDKFYENIDTVIHDLTKYYSKKDNRVFVKSSLFLQILGLIVAGLPTFGGVYYTIYNVVYEADWGFLGGMAFLMLDILCIVLLYYAVSSRYSMKRSKFIALSIFSLIVGALVIAAYHAVFIFFDGNGVVLYSTLGLSITLLWSALFMDKRTDKGNEWLGQILGLKDFIEVAEKEQLEELVHENPQYFYDVLPYAYVLGISDVWAKKFADIVMDNATWYQSEKHLPVHLFMPRYYRCMNNLQEQLYHIPDIETSSGGGSISSGGGFSGGGFGGGGGGSW